MGGDSIVLTVAHRLRTVLGTDRILVLDHGCRAQLGSPSELLEEQGIFRELASQAGLCPADGGAMDKLRSADSPFLDNHKITKSQIKCACLPVNAYTCVGAWRF